MENRMRKYYAYSKWALVIALLIFSAATGHAATMDDYCLVPPYVVQNIPPNVMVVMDNSGSMMNFAYSDGFFTPTDTSDDNNCASSGSPCMDYQDLVQGRKWPQYTYYGYFDPDYWYVYSGQRFIQTAPKYNPLQPLPGMRPKAGGEWDGDFLNWLTMRRVDVMRSVMTGGKLATGEGAGFDRLRGEPPDYSGRGIYKRMINSQFYTPYGGTRTFTFGTGGTQATFTVSGVGGSFNVAVRVPSPVEGVLQDVVGTRARVGLAFYNPNTPNPQGGSIRVYVSGGSLSSTVNEINLTAPNSNTPLGETLWTVTGYFSQKASLAGGPGPRYQGGDYQINNNVDPMNYGSGGSTRFPVCAKNYVLYLTDGDPCSDGYLPGAIETYANGRSDFDCSGSSCPAVSGTSPETWSFPATTFPSCGAGNNVAGIEDVALYMHTNDLRGDMNGDQELTLYTIYAFGRGSSLLKFAAINGGFEDSNGNGVPDLESEWHKNGREDPVTHEYLPDTFYEATDGTKLEQAIRDAFSNILSRAASGTAASVLASGEGKGASLLQAIFYPRRRFGNKIIDWTGLMQNLWYYVDPMFSYSNTREDTVRDLILNTKEDYIGMFYFDNDTQTTKAKLASDTDGNGSPDVQMGSVPFEELHYLWEVGTRLWSRDLATDPRTIYVADPTDNNPSDGINLIDFTTSNWATLAPYMDITDVNANGLMDETQNVIRYIQGETLTTEDTNGDGINDIFGQDLNGDGLDDFRSRFVSFRSPYTYLLESHEWKLGDILDSTPKTATYLPLNTYHYPIAYKDITYGPLNKTTPAPYETADNSRYITTGDNPVALPSGDTVYSTGYKSRGEVFTGANDGMLHAFKLGTLSVNWTGQGADEKAWLINLDPAVPLGNEDWAFIPKNVLPYLKYIGDPDYCHLYAVDLSPYLVDASINKPAGCAAADYWNCDKTVDSWRTILIGGMRFGGACRGTSTVCTDVDGDGSKDCVNTPVDVGGQSIGFSSYFALDVTDFLNDHVSPPVLLWEFTDPRLGYATTGPAVVKIAAKNAANDPLPGKNGKWFAVFGSGPTGPIDTQNHQFMGSSDQNLRYFVFDLRQGPGLNNADVEVIDTLIPYAFAGSLSSATFDNEISPLDYQDDAVYSGYVRSTGLGTNASPRKWDAGGVGRIMTFANLDPANWRWKNVTDPTDDRFGPITSSIVHLRNTKYSVAWLFFGSGRHYFATETTNDDENGQRRLYGIKDPCYCNFSDPLCTSPLFDTQSMVGLSTSCVTTVGFNDLNDSTLGTAQDKNIALQDDTWRGWRIDLDTSGNYSHLEGDPPAAVARDYFAERMITDPLARRDGSVFFTTYKPYDGECTIGGHTFLWGVEGETGGDVMGLTGKVIMQVSTGAIEQVDLSSALNERQGRRGDVGTGVPPTNQGMSLLSSPPPVKKYIHIRER